MAARKPALFPDAPAAPPPARPAAAPTGPLVRETDWGVVDHVCGRCFARLVGRVNLGRTHFRCTGCGHSSDPDVEGMSPLPPPGRRQAPAICACHLRFAGRNAGLRCVVNDHRGPANPTEIVARQVL